jgi:hypothetical protein
MAITISDQPNTWSPRGQRLLFYLTSTQTAQPGFRIRAEVTVNSTGDIYAFMLSVDPYGGIIYDLGSLVTLRNYEDDPNLHALTGEAEEPQGSGYDRYQVTFQEYWTVGGVLTPQGSATTPVQILVVNGYYQMSDGYKPNANIGSIDVKYALSSAANSRAMSDRFSNTHSWTKLYSAYVGTPFPGSIYIPVREADFGQLVVPGGSSYLTSNAIDAWRISLVDSAGAAHTWTSGSLSGYPVTTLGVYPANLNADPAVTEKPMDYPQWRYYVLSLLNAGGSAVAARYVFYNAEEWGQWDCRYSPVRLAWVNSRGGWDYFNFIKKNEITDAIERKQYKQTRWRSSSPFYLSSDRVLTDRETLVTQTLSVTSDWVQEEEYVFLRGLLVSNQVHIVNDDGTFTPCSIEDTSFLERRERNGKLYNIALQVKYSQDYWT